MFSIAHHVGSVEELLGTGQLYAKIYTVLAMHSPHVAEAYTRYQQ